MAEFRHHVASQLRAASSRYPQDPAIGRLVSPSCAQRPDFVRLWNRHDMQIYLIITKTFEHREIGAISVDCDTLMLFDRGQQLVLFTAEPGS